MKTTEIKKKKFDAVKMMRDIRDQMDEDIKGMTYAEEKEYFKSGSNKLKKQVTQKDRS